MALKRRKFLLAGAAVGGGLIVGWGLLPPRARLGKGKDFGDLGQSVALNGWVRVSPDGTVTVAVPRSEMGQGVYTALPTLVAEEMDCPLERIAVEQAPIASLYGNIAMLVDSLPFHPDSHGNASFKAAEWIVSKLARELGVQATGGSSSVKDAWQPMRMAGATARAMLLNAAAGKLGVVPADCSVKDGVISARNGKSLQFGEVAREAANLPVPDAELKNPKNFSLIGKATPRLDSAEKTDGSAEFGIDVRLPGMVYAAVAMCPTFGGALQWFDANVALGMPGVLRVMPLPPAMGAQAGIAVVAQHYWQARQALAKLPVRWDAGRHGKLDNLALMQQLRTALDGEKGWSYHDRGDGVGALAGAAKSIKAEYSAPLLAHAAMEPINCTAQFKDGTLTLWASTQVPGLAKQLVGSVLGLASENVAVVTKLLGGGFGRRLEMDFIAQAALVAKLTEGKPVQVIWSREEDMRHDAYRPPAVTQWQGGLDAQGNLFALVSKSASGSVVYDFTKRALPAFAAQTPDKTTDEGLFDRPYEVVNQSHRQVAIDSPVPLGFWRSVGHSMNAFFAESFMDECAAAAAKDPLEFRRAMLKNHPRHLKVLDTVAQKAGWGSPVAAGRARGIALHQSFGSIVAEVAEVSLEEGKPRVHKVWAAIDCGIAVNPNIIAQQVESAVLFGLSAALYGEITLKDGAVVQGNYNDYAVLRGKDAPEVETFIIDSSEAPTGVGEPGTPPIAPAVANALFTLTGKRLRSLPLRMG